MGGATSHRENADSLLAQILAQEEKATPAELRQMLADMRGMPRAERQVSNGYLAGLKELGNVLAELIVAHIQGDAAMLKLLPDGIVAERVQMMDPQVATSAAVAPAPETLQ